MEVTSHVSPTDRTDTPEPLALTVLEAVAARKEVAITGLPPLSDAINPDALDAIFSPLPSGEKRRNGHVEFDYCGYTVVADADGHVTLHRESGA